MRFRTLGCYPLSGAVESEAATLEAIVAELAGVREGIDFVFLPGDNANHATADQYDRIRAALAPLTLPVFTIPGDHDFEDGTLAAFRAGTPAAWLATSAP